MVKNGSKDLWWSYSKRVIREYSEYLKNPAECRLKRFEYEAVQRAIEKTRLINNGAERLKLIDLVFWKQTRSLEGACLACYVSDRTGRQWHTDFIRLVGVEMGLCKD